MDALALEGEEGRDYLRKATGSWFELRSVDIRMGEPDAIHLASSCHETIVTLKAHLGN